MRPVVPARCAASLLAAAITLPSRELEPVDVVRAQLEALQADDIRTCYSFASPSNRRSIGPWPNLEIIVKRTPSYSPLIDCESFELLSALSLGERWTARVRVRPSEARLRCLDRAASPAVGERVRLSSDIKQLRRAMDTVDYRWSDLMAPMAGAEHEVLCLSRPNRGTNVVGLPSPDGSQGGVWYFPVTALERADGDDADGAAPEEACEFRWALSRQPDVDIALGLGQVIVHKKFAYRGVVVGYDPVCMQSDEWCSQMNVDQLSKGRRQPFYHVLVDRRDRPGEQITYVAEENAVRPPTDGPFAVEPVEHAMVGEMLRPASFDGARGAYEPNDELRALYPERVQGCWMVDSVVPDSPAAEMDDAVDV